LFDAVARELIFTVVSQCGDGMIEVGLFRGAFAQSELASIFG
jgi:hypothetical protein